MMLNYRKSTQRVFCLIFLFCLSYTVIADVTEQKKVEVSQSKMVFTAHDSFMYVTIVGKLKNNSNYPLKDIILEAQFYNADGALIDTVSESLYSMVIPANDEIAFKLQTNAAQKQDKYASHAVRVIGLEEDKPCASGNTSQSWLNLLISWGPFLVIVLILMKKFTGKNSPQQKSITLIEKQNELFEKQNQLLSRIAGAVERHMGQPSDQPDNRLIK